MAVKRTSGGAGVWTWLSFLIAGFAMLTFLIWRSPWFQSLLDRFELVR
ncbi:MAG: hypothetical protein ACE14M_10855 [Terriglobales bacterium]